MERTTIMLPHELRLKANHYASKHHLSLGSLIRKSLEKIVAEESADRDPFFADQVVYLGEAPEDGAHNHDDYLYGEESVHGRTVR